MTATIRVSAAVVMDAAGRALVVRKRGTASFMQPGGKPEPGESAAAALVRELAEELGVKTDAAALTSLGTFTAAAANEPGHDVVRSPAHDDAADSREEVVELEAARAGGRPLVNGHRYPRLARRLEPRELVLGPGDEAVE